VYDDEHFGEFVDVVANFTNTQTEYTEGGDLSALCWLSTSPAPEAEGAAAEARSEALLAVGGEDCTVSLISVAAGCVTALLKGHTKPVKCLTSAAGRPGLLASLGGEGAVKVWDTAQQECLCTLECDGASAVCLSPCGSELYVGCVDGGVWCWGGVAEAGGATPGGQRKRKKAEANVMALKGVAARLSGAHDKQVDCIKPVGSGKIGTKSVDGNIKVWGISSKAVEHAWRVPNSQAPFNRSDFGCTSDGAYLAAGSKDGSTCVFDVEKGGELVVKLHGKRAEEPVTAAAISEDCRHVLAAQGRFIFRYEFVNVPAAEEVKEEPAGKGA